MRISSVCLCKQNWGEKNNIHKMWYSVQEKNKSILLYWLPSKANRKVETHHECSLQCFAVSHEATPTWLSRHRAPNSAMTNRQQGNNCKIHKKICYLSTIWSAVQKAMQMKCVFFLSNSEMDIFLKLTMDHDSLFTCLTFGLTLHREERIIPPDTDLKQKSHHCLIRGDLIQGMSAHAQVFCRWCTGLVKKNKTPSTSFWHRY